MHFVNILVFYLAVVIGWLHKLCSVFTFVFVFCDYVFSVIDLAMLMRQAILQSSLVHM